MGSMRRRLERLERRATPQQGPYSGGTSRRVWERYFHAHENARRGLHGLEPLPELPYTQEDREDDERTLEHTIPAYRSSRSGETDQMAAFLDSWEREIRERIERTTNG